MDWTVIGLGCLGGAIPDVIRLVQGRYNQDLPNYLRQPNFWIGFVLLIVIGGLAAWLGDATGLKEALAYGYAAPELIARFLSSTNPPTRKAFSLQDLRHFWSY
jgi:hypothetical protein